MSATVTITEATGEERRASTPLIAEYGENVNLNVTLSSLSSAVFQRGAHLAVPKRLHAENRARLCKKLRAAITEAHGERAIQGAVIFLKGGEGPMRYDSDHEPIFRQDSWFQWLFGVKEADVCGAVRVEDAKAVLFVPKLPESYATWMGKIQTNDEIREAYGVHEVHYLEETLDTMKNKSLLGAKTIHLLSGPNTDSGAVRQACSFTGMAANFSTDSTKLFNCFTECRAIKTNLELDVLRYANVASSEAHCAVMKHIHPGMYEFQIEATFLHCAYHDFGCRHAGYTSICGCGPNGATLHYGHAGAPNDRELKDGEMILCDMGAEYHCYGADITRTIPVNGKYTDDQRAIYQAVLDAQQAVMDNAKPGVCWTDMHLLANKVLLRALQKIGIIRKNASIDKAMSKHLAAVFQPHGLGHMLGLDTHDVGGDLDDGVPVQRSTAPGLRSLRCNRVLKENMVVTIEPGCYFIDHLLDTALADKELAVFLDEKVLQRFRGFGGVRIEDDVIITANGVINMTTAPRTPAAIEAFMAKNNENLKAYRASQAESKQSATTEKAKAVSPPAKKRSKKK